MSARPVSSPDHNISHWRWLPLLTPAVKENSCEIDNSLLELRIAVVVAAALAVLVPAMLLTIAFPMAISVVPLSFLLLGAMPLDTWIAERAANLKAVDEYLNNRFPSGSAAFRLRNNFKAVQLLIHRKGDVNKVDERGERLLDYCSNLDIFKLLINNGANIKGINKFGTSYFQKAIENRNPAYLEYVLKKDKAAPLDFNATEQIQFWQNLGNIGAGHLLIKHGFNVNIKDEYGYTPLLRVVEAASKLCDVARLDLIIMLLICGADPTITINDEEGVQKNAMDIASPQIRKILERGIKLRNK